MLPELLTNMMENTFKVYDNTIGDYKQLELYPKQKELIKSFEENKLNLVTNSRQVGISTLLQTYTAIKAFINNNESILFVNTKRSLSQITLTKIKLYLNQIPKWVWGEGYVNNDKSIFVIDNRNHIKLPNGSEIIFSEPNIDILCGRTFNTIIIDNAGFLTKPTDLEFHNSIITSISSNGNYILTSSPNNEEDNLHYRIYKNSDNDFKRSYVKWYENPKFNKDLYWTKRNENTGEIISLLERKFTTESYESMINAGYKPNSLWYKTYKNILGPSQSITEIDCEID